MSQSPFEWDDLLEYIDDRRVIPILGPELLRVTENGVETTLHSLLAQRLAKRLNLPADALSAVNPLNQVVCRHLEKGGQREDVYSRLRSVMKELQLPTPDPLRKLAQIRHFTLYVSTTFDCLLEQALNQERFAGAAKTQSFAYAPNLSQDLPCALEKLERPTVYQLLGRLSASPDYATTDEDTLEFFSALQAEGKRPHLLFDELKDKHLLLIGCNFPGWLAKFFLRLAKSSRLSLQRSASEILADERDREDSDLVVFLKHFSYRTRIYPEGGAVAFVDELWTRYQQRHPPGNATPAVAAQPSSAEQLQAMDMPPGAVFISYAHEDLAAARVLCEALEAAGLDVWFDKKDLTGGDFWNAKINRNIRNCSYFVPIISKSTEQRPEGYFRREWRWAAERSEDIADGIAFLLPVAAAGIGQADALVPKRFQDVQWTSLPLDTPSVQEPELRKFVELMVRHYREYRKREKGLL